MIDVIEKEKNLTLQIFIFLVRLGEIFLNIFARFPFFVVVEKKFDRLEINIIKI